MERLRAGCPGHCRESFCRVGDPAENAALRLDHFETPFLEIREIGADTVRGDEAVESAVVGLAHSGVHSDLSGQAGDDELGNAEVLQNGVEIGGEECALARLVDHRLAREGQAGLP